jgi:hypothetical protein
MTTRSIVPLTALLLSLSTSSVTSAADDAAPRLPNDEERALAARAEAVIRMAEGTPGQEAANMLNEWPRQFLALLAGTNPAAPVKLAQACSAIRELVDRAELGLSWPKPPTLRIPARRWRAPKVDGRLDEWAWRKALKLSGTVPLNTTNALANPRTTYRLMWDKQYLYLGFECEDADIAAPPIERDGPVYNADCVEAFILPNFEDRLYWEIITSPTGSLFDSLQHKKLHNWGLDGQPEKTLEGLQIGRVMRGTPNNPADRDEGYTIEMAIPFSQLPGYTEGKTPAAGQRLHLLLARFDRTGKDIVFTYPFPVLSWGHNIWNYAPAELVR